MKDRNVDEYIATFQVLGYRAGMKLDDLSVLRLFAQGLLQSLADVCINIDSPENFEQWTNTAQCQHKNWLRKQAIHRDYSVPHLNSQNLNQG
jgi:hypothetical protein